MGKGGRAAAASTGSRMGRERAKTKSVGNARKFTVDAAASESAHFQQIFEKQPKGPYQDRLSTAFEAYSKTNTSADGDVKQQVEFLCKISDMDKNGQLDDKEVAFAFLVYRVWMEQHKEFESHFAKFDRDQNGKLDADEFLNLLIDLNEGEDVSKDEAEWVMKRADISGDGAIQLVELVVAVSVWYCDLPLYREKRPKCLWWKDLCTLIFCSRETHYTERRKKLDSVGAF